MVLPFYMGWSPKYMKKSAGKGPKLTFPAETMWTWAAGKALPTFAKRTPPPAGCAIPKTDPKDCKPLSKSEPLSPHWLVHRKHQPRKSESNTA